MKLFKRKVDKVLIDFSGHSDVKFAVENVADPNAYENVVAQLILIIQKEYNEYAENGRVIVILPGFSQLAAAFLAAFHGFYGYFPEIKWYIQDRQTKTFDVSKRSIDLQKIRYEFRKMRTNLDVRT